MAPSPGHDAGSGGPGLHDGTATDPGLDAVAGSAYDDDVPRHVERVLAEFLDRRRAEMLHLDPDVAELADTLSGFVLGGGKRLRPVFAWWGWRGAGGAGSGPEAEQVLVAVAALELIQACALVHDDLMDASSTRRGRPTVHVEFARVHDAAGWSGPAARFGAAAAILVGDLAQVWADDMLHTAGLSAETQARAGEPWRAMRSQVLAGQYLDVLAQASGDASEHGAMRVNRHKTAAYTVERPLHLGAALAGAGPELVDAYRRYGADIGVAFQLRDDLLGVFGDPQVTGKPAGRRPARGQAHAARRARARAGRSAAATTRPARRSRARWATRISTRNGWTGCVPRWASSAPSRPSSSGSRR